MPPTIFISYRREDTQFAAGRLYDRLVQQFGERSVFMDVAAIDPGADYRQRIHAAVSQCTVLIPLIGPKWACALDGDNKRRLDNADDLVRLEVEAGLSRTDVRVIPVLVDGAMMPSAAELPAEIQALSRRNALSLHHTTFQTDVARLIESVAGADERYWWMNPALWLGQVFLSGTFAFHGVLRLLYGPEELASVWGITYAARQSAELLRFVGVAQLGAAIVLAVPWLTWRIPRLVAAAAAGLALSMVLGLLDHLIHGEFALLSTSLVIGAIAFFVAWGRFNHRPPMASGK